MDHSDHPSKVKQRANDPAGPSSESSLGSTNEAVSGKPRESEKRQSENEALSPDLAARLNALDDDTLDDVRRAKVEKIKKALADGTYVVSAEDLADKLIEHMLDRKD